MYSFIWAILPFFTNNRYALEGFLTSCSFDYISTNLSNKIVIISMFIGGFFIPLFVIVLFYIMIVYLLRKNEIFLTYQLRNSSLKKSQTTYLNSVNNLNDESSINQTENIKLSTITFSKYSGSFNSAVSTNYKRPVYLKREVKLIKMISIIVLMFVIAWTPYSVVTLAAQLGSNIEAYINPYTTSLPALFAKTSSVYNPLIYTLSNKEFRRFFFNYFLKKLKMYVFCK